VRSVCSPGGPQPKLAPLTVDHGWAGEPGDMTT
jgi:hypothetical protein